MLDDIVNDVDLSKRLTRQQKALLSAMAGGPVSKSDLYQVLRDTGLSSNDVRSGLQLTATLRVQVSKMRGAVRNAGRDIVYDDGGYTLVPFNGP
jgi:hypothetical protein